ncbi:DUF4336 domain-containing protein [Skeletonema marinoi]|uniref:DUF4336 domain-containing protein n=2 Tax=Skeletonema marinoi TaxID=267567 RepID=A0AAD8XT83_9STRA|nr:DUF4336 domain-containing protein [Skeletonema marinoi]
MIRIITITILLLVSSTQYTSAYTFPSASFQRTNPRGTTYTTTKTALASSSHHDNDLTSIHVINEQLRSNISNDEYSSKHVFRTSNAKLQPSRRDAIESFLSIATAITTTTAATLSSPSSALATTTAAAAVPIPPQSRYTSWPLGKVAFSLLPLAGSYTRRATVMEEVVPNTIWTMDQIQGVVNVNVPVRMTVIKLSQAAGGGGLWILNPLAPTPQLIQQIRALEAQHGPVRHVVLGTVALEHKATFGPFAQYFSKATLWFQPGQWSFPVQVPIEFLGVTQSGDQVRVLPSSQFIHGDVTLDEEVKSIRPSRYQAAAKKLDAAIPEWTSDIDYETLGPLTFQSVGAFSETAFYHKSTQTLIVTDSVCSVTKDPPKVIEEDPRALLFHARDSIEDIVVDDLETRRKGWRRMVQFGLVFFPSQIEVVPFGKAVQQSVSEIDPSMKTLGVGAVPGGSLYPWTWHDNDADLANFNAISQDGKLFCPPILTKLILDREPTKTLEWVDRITKRFPKFTHVIPGHLNNYVKASPKEFSQAFDPLRSNPKGGKVYEQRALAEDLALLQEASDLLTQFGVVAKTQVCDLEPARSVGRFAAIAPK